MQTVPPDTGTQAQRTAETPQRGNDPSADPPGHRPSYRILGRQFRKPGSAKARYALAIGLICGGLLGFLPVLGFWMLPLGILILSHELHVLRRLRRRWVVWRGRQKTRRAGAGEAGN